MRIELRALRYFLSVADQGSFSRAAEVSHVAQSALSRQVKRLEEDCGTPLLVRHPRGVTLTAAGTELHKRAEALLNAAECLTDGLAQTAPEPDSVIRIGLPPVLGQRLGARIISEFRSLWPRVGIQIKLAGSAALTDWLAGGQIEVALIHNATALEGISLETLLQETLHVVQHPDEPPVAVYPVNALAKLPLILTSWPDNDRRLLEGHAERHAFRIQPALEIDSIPLIRSSIEQGLGMAVLPLSVVQDEVAAGRLKAVPLAGMAKSTLSLATCHDVPSTLALAGLRRCVRQVMADAMRDGQWQGAVLAGRDAQVGKTG